MADGIKLSDLSADEAEEIIRDNYSDIFKYCCWRVKNYSDAEDLTQETFMRFIDHLSHYSEQGKPKALLYTIARNLCINWYKQNKPLSLSEADDKRMAATVNDEIKTIENKIVLHKYLIELPLEQQEVLLLRYYHELQVNEIAHIMGLNRFAVMYRIRTAVSTLRKKLGKEYSYYEK